VAVFLILHLAINARGMAGEAAFERSAAAVRRLPLWGAIELFGIVLPLAFHALYGVKLALDSSRAPPGRYVRDAVYLAQRVSGVITLLFIAYHLWDFWAAKLLGRIEPEAFYGLLASRLSSTAKGVPLNALVYLLGVSAAVFHMTNGLFAVSRTFGFITSRRGRKALLVLLALLGGGVWLLGASTAIYFATGLRWAALARAVPHLGAPW
jgi:succinate dehydrogenase/fumarate reductase cytochrome b subunit (b558 family)